MPELLIPLFILYLIYLATLMKKPTTPPAITEATDSDDAKASSTAESALKETVGKVKSANSTQPATPKPAAKTKPVKPAATQPESPLPSQAAKAPKKSTAKAATEAAGTPDLTLTQRVGLTAGSIWRYLSENGATSVATLVKALPEEEKVIQRSIGWLAQEGKITLETADKVETVALSDNR